MDYCLIPDWNTEIGVDFPNPIQRKSHGLDSDLMELLWQNGEVIMHSQTNHRQQTNSTDPSKSKQFHKTNHQSTSGATEISNTFIHDDETTSWIECPIDESFEKEFCANFLSDEIPNNPLDDKNIFKFSASEVDDVIFPAPRFEIGNVPESSVRTIGNSHCASNQVVEKVKSARSESGHAIASCSGGSGNSNFWKTSSRSNETNRQKRKNRDVEESECPSDATELESGSGNKSRTNRRTRVAEVHNMSERRRRDRINEKMKALQELIPHSNKSDKASMLDEAIEYMKSLQLQLQLMWMGSRMGPMMMLPGPHHYMSRAGMGVGPQMFQNLMRLSRSPLVHQAINIASMQNQGPMGPNPVAGQVNYQNQMQNSSFSEQYANYMGFHSTPNTSQPMNMFDFGFHSSQQNQVSAPPNNGNGAIG